MRNTAALVCILCFAAFAADKPASRPSTQPATKPSAAMKRAIDAGEAERLDDLAAVATNLASAKQHLAGMQRGAVDRNMQPGYTVKGENYRFSSQAVKDGAVARQKLKVQKYEAEKNHLESQKGIRTPWIEEPKINAVGRLPELKIVQVVDAKNMLVNLRGLILWLEVETAGLVDDTSYTPAGVYEVQETRQYTTPVGTKTVFVLRRIDQ